jgi:pimeloyl-ACP methyl ester carboxylesterase
MARLWVIGSFFVLLALGVTAAAAQGLRPGQMVLAPYSLKTFDGKDQPCELGRLSVREDRTGASGRLIQLAFVRLRSTAARPDPPIVFLMGGPGIPGIVMGQVPEYFRLFDRLRSVADVILLDQRGTGMSSPHLECPSNSMPCPSDFFLSKEKALRELTRRVREGARYWKAQGVNPAAYNTNASADDVEDLRRALGADRLSLLGFSYGTELALAIIRRHGHSLHRVVLAGVRGPDQVLMLPSDLDLQLRRISYLAAQDPTVGREVPDLVADLKQVLRHLEHHPATVMVKDGKPGQPVPLTIGRAGLQELIYLNMSDIPGITILPALLATMKRGDYSILSRLLDNRIGLSMMAVNVECASGASIERRSQARREARASLLGDVAGLMISPEISGAVGNPDLGPEFRTRLWSTVPTLFVSGTLDCHPLYQVEQVRWGFPNSVHLIVENGGHETLPNREVQSDVVDFFAGQDVSGRTVYCPPPRFLSVEEAKSRS